MSEAYLSQIFVKIAELEKIERKVLLVFDLDSTLFDVSHRTQQILMEFAQLPEILRKYPQEAELLKQAQVTIQDWGYAEALRRMGSFESAQAMRAELFQFWKKHFFSDPYLHFDQPVPGAVEFVNQLLNFENTEIVYLTGRDQNRMGKGTVEVLKKWNFPVAGPKTQLILKPHQDLEDAAFKTKWFLDHPEIHQSAVWFFENEPVNINHLRKTLSHIEIVFFESTHSQKEQPPVDLPKIRNFRTA